MNQGSWQNKDRRNTKTKTRQTKRHSKVKDETLLINIEEVAFMILKDKEKSKDKEKEKNRTDLDIEEVALMFPTGPLMLRQIVP